MRLIRKTILIFCIFPALVSAVYSRDYDIPRLSPKVKTVQGIRNPVISLNGTWHFYSASIPDSPIEVPGEWTMQGFYVPDEETAFYKRTVNIPSDWQNKRIKIRFDAVSSHGLVKLNGKTVGEHEGGMVPFEVDITDAVSPGENELTVEVRTGTVSDRLGCISQYACHPVGGLLRKVTLFALPEINIASMDVVTTLDKSYKHAELNITAGIAKEANFSGSLSVEYILVDPTGKVISKNTQDVKNTETVKGKLSVKNAGLWNTEQPCLYTLKTSLLLDGKPLQTNEQTVGIRQVEVKGNVLYVNGKPVKLRGVDRHEVHPLRGRSLTPELCRKDAELFKAGNCNYIRTSHYPPSEEFLDACNEIGLFVESEATLNWIQHHASPIWKKWDYQDEQYLPYMLRANMDNILAGRRHPSVIIWSIANESRWSPLWEKVKMMVKEMDPSRPNSFHDQCWGGFNNAGNTADIANYHYPGINGPAACDTMSRPVLFGEYAHLTCYNSRELVTDPGVRAAYGKYLVEMYDSIYYHSACLGGAIWGGIDDIFHLPGGKIVGYGPWGVIDAWRREKPEYTGMKKAYTPFRILEEKWDANQLELTVENRYNFVSFDQVSIEAGNREGRMTRIKSSIPARSKGKVIIPLNEINKQNIYLKVTDLQGNVCHEELFAASNIAPEKEADCNLTVEDENNLLKIHSENSSGRQTVVFNKISGLLTHAYSGDKTLLKQGPVFCLVPMNSDDGGKPNVAGETYQNTIHPLRDYPYLTLFAKDFKYRKDNTGNVIVEIEALYVNGDTGKLVYVFGKDRHIKVSYEITVAAKEIRPRQYGLLLQLPKQMEKLGWSRKGEFSVYPEHDIARTEGTAILNANNLYEVEAWGKTPEGAWKEDANRLGSVDFRSTKTQMLKASLIDSNRNGIIVYGNGIQAWRSWLQDECIYLLIADYSNTGSERFYGSPFTTGRITIKEKDVLKGKIVFKLQ
ncbi:MAG: glycoside hydrolase family 2 [Tannerella sp.]|nr:glycoside hydrolase family 2 [Tannerella sp.]